LTAAAIEALCRYPWPGNVRELMNTLEAVVVASSSETIDAAHLPPTIQGEIARPAARPPLHAGRTMRDIEADAIASTLAMVGGSRTHAAEILGIGLRTLRRRIAELGLDHTLPPRPGRPRRADQDGPSADKKNSSD
jgi:DNA-binding NtrC family response regulator